MNNHEKLVQARRSLAQIADECTDSFKNQAMVANHDLGEVLRHANWSLAIIREIAQDAAEATLDKVETRT